MIKTDLEGAVRGAVEALGLPAVKFLLDCPTDLTHGDYSANTALILGKQLEREPDELAAAIVTKLKSLSLDNVAEIKVASPGFINFFLTPQFFRQQVEIIVATGESFGQNEKSTGQKVMIEYTDPNPFKEFHIGHLMSNTIGEALSRLIASGGAEVKRACYQGDIGLHVAKAVWGMKTNGVSFEKENELNLAAERLGEAYAAGAAAYEANEAVKQVIQDINKKIYDRSDPAINRLYDQGRQVSLDYFATIYQTLGTKFDFYFF